MRVASFTPASRVRRDGGMFSSSPTVCTPRGSSADNARAVSPARASGVASSVRASARADSARRVSCTLGVEPSTTSRIARQIW
ncbi:MAG TPA: hypothetical protein VJM75_08765, partial [Acidimicrobiales bacterium]|nr:hypothetical protein [Acidimicrobiales bacterium]